MSNVRSNSGFSARRFIVAVFLGLAGYAAPSSFTANVQQELIDLAEKEAMAKKLSKEYGPESRQARDAWAEHADFDAKRKRYVHEYECPTPDTCSIVEIFLKTLIVLFFDPEPPEISKHSPRTAQNRIVSSIVDECPKFRSCS